MAEESKDSGKPPNQRVNGMEAREYWEKSLKRKAKTTKTEYERYFDAFLSWADLDAEGLYNLQKESLESDDIRESDKVSELVGEFMDYMRDEKQYSNSTQNQALKAVKSFFDANKLHFKIKPLRRRRISGGVLRITGEQIREVYDYAMGIEWTTLRNRALYMILKDSGLRISDAANLDVEQYHQARDVEIRGVPFKVFEPFPTVKTGDLAHTILGPESIKVLDKLIGERVSGPIFLDGKGCRWRAPAMSTHFRRVKKYALGGKLRISAHSYRKYNTTTLESAGMPLEWIKILQGKKAYVYSRPQDGPELVEAYAKAYDKLRIFPHEHLDQEVRSLREELDHLRAYIETWETIDPKTVEAHRIAEVLDNQLPDTPEAWSKLEALIKKLREARART